MKVDLPGKFPQVTVVLSGMTLEYSKTDGKDVALMATEEEDQIADQGGVVVHKDVVGILSRRVVALENRLDRIESQIGSFKCQWNGRLARIEDKLKALLKVQQKILNGLDRIHSFTEQSSSTHVVGITDHLPLEQKRKRMWETKSRSTSSTTVHIRCGKYRRSVKSSPYTESSLIKCYRRMRAKQAAVAVPPPASGDGSTASAISLASTPHELGLNDIGSSTASTSAGHGMEEPQLE